MHDDEKKDKKDAAADGNAVAAHDHDDDDDDNITIMYTLGVDAGVDGAVYFAMGNGMV